MNQVPVHGTILRGSGRMLCILRNRVLNYDYRDHSRTKKFDTRALLEQLPALQQLLFRVLACQPGGAAFCSFMIQYALSIVAAESVRLYVGITDGILNLVDKYFEMQQHDAVRALEIYRRAGDQALRLSNFYEMCRSLEFGRRRKYAKIEQNEDNHIQKVVIEPASTLGTDTEEGSHPSADSIEDQKIDNSAEAAPLIPDLLSWEEPCQEASELAEQASPVFQ